MRVGIVGTGLATIVGVSLGGLLALAVARDHPECVRRVVTLASPFCLPTASSIEPLIRLSALLYPPALDMASLRLPLPVPTTAVYTCDDGIVAWQSCSREEPNCRPVEVRGAHVTICRNPVVLRTLAQALALAA